MPSLFLSREILKIVLVFSQPKGQWKNSKTWEQSYDVVVKVISLSAIKRKSIDICNRQGKRNRTAEEQLGELARLGDTSSSIRIIDLWFPLFPTRVLYAEEITIRAKGENRSQEGMA